MAYDVTSWFIDQLSAASSEPVRVFALSGFHYSDRVKRWPVLRRKAQDMKISELTIGLANNDAGLNSFYDETFSIVQSATLEFGFNGRPDTGEKISEFATSEYEPSPFVDPQGIAADPDGTLWVGDGNHTKIYNIEKDGTLISSFNTNVYDAFANSPRGISTDPNGTLWVIDFATEKIYNIKASKELIKVFTGSMKNINYSREACTIRLVDKLAVLARRTVGDSTNPVSMGAQIPSEIAWTLCTCYGGLSNVRSTSNIDIDYASFLVWADVFSSNNVTAASHYEGLKVTEALSRLAVMTDSAIWGEGDGKVNFARFEVVGSDDITLNEEILNLDVIIQDKRLVNKQIIGFNYSVESGSWNDYAFDESSISVNSFGLYENIIEDKTVWYVDSASALNLAQRKTLLFDKPPREFQVQTGLRAAQMQISDTVRIVDRFFGITSAFGWRSVGIDFNMDTGTTNHRLDSATLLNLFRLDISELDGTDTLG